MTYPRDSSVPVGPATRGRPHRLVGGPVAAVAVPSLDPDQRAVVEHRNGPLLVLAGPGTGKTTTLVEAVVDRVERGAPGGGGIDPARVLVLTFSRKAAQELRTRITARLDRTTTEAVAWTFHGFCYALLRRYQDAERFADPLRLLSGPEQQAVVRDLLEGSLEVGTAAWPVDLSGLLRRRGFVEEVRRLLARVRQLGLDPVDLAELADRSNRPDWRAAALFGEEYLDVLDLRGVLDYGELVRAAAALAAEPDVRAELRARYDVVFVDEYQDTDPAQEQLLQEIAGDGRDLVVVGDPDQSIYSFRGAEVDNILDFAHRFPTARGGSAPVRVLRSSRRLGPELLQRSRGVAERIPLPGLPADAVRRHRTLVPAEQGGCGTRATTGAVQLSLLDSEGEDSESGADDDAAEREETPASTGAVTVLHFPTAGAEVETIADLLRRAHLEDAAPWSQMAVLVRSGVRSIATLRRALVGAGVPVDVAGDEVPLVREPAARALLLALRAAVALDPRANPAGVAPLAITAETVRDLLGSPLIAASPRQLRMLSRALRARDRERVAELDVAPRPSGELLLEAVVDLQALTALPAGLTWPLAELARLLQRVRAAEAGDGTVEDALWALWSGTSWPQRLEATSRSGGAAGRRADADLDAVVALFDLAARAEERVGRVGVGDFVEQVQAQQIPADTLAEQSVRDEAVRLLTAHRAKGLEWEVVVVAGVQEDVWPDLRRRDSLLGAERIGRLADGGATGVDPPTTASLLVEERRLFYVAVTRARRRLICTAVSSPGEEGGRPSRFLAELGVEPLDLQSARPRRLAIPDLVADLRATAADPTASAAVRQAAAERLARLAAARSADGRQLVPAADPSTWWGLAEPSDPGTAMRRADEPIRLHGSALELLGNCPLHWFLDREARGSAGSNRAAGFGSIVHALAEAVTQGTLPVDLESLTERVDAVWSRLEFEIPWHSDRERSQARAALARFLEWHAADRGRRVGGAERSVTLRLEVAGRPVEIRGRIDRLEVDAEGRVWVVDLKTTKTPRSADRVERDPQLAVYQLAVRSGAIADLPGVADPPQTAGAELVYLRTDAGRGSSGPKIVRQRPLDPAERHPAEDVLEVAVARVADERFPAVVGTHCQVCAFKRSCPADPYGQQVVS